MINRGQFGLGLALVVMGVVFLIGTIFKIDVWAICWPTGLILVGLWLVLRPQLAAPGSITDVTLLGDVRRRGKWVVQNSDTWLGVADVDMDFTEAEIPPGETCLRFYGFVSDIKMYLPSDLGISVYASGFVVDTDLLGKSNETFLTPVQIISDGYAEAERRLRIEATGFVTEIKVKMS